MKRKINDRNVILLIFVACLILFLLFGGKVEGQTTSYEVPSSAMNTAQKGLYEAEDMLCQLYNELSMAEFLLSRQKRGERAAYRAVRDSLEVTFLTLLKTATIYSYEPMNVAVNSTEHQSEKVIVYKGYLKILSLFTEKDLNWGRIDEKENPVFERNFVDTTRAMIEYYSKKK